MSTISRLDYDLIVVGAGAIGTAYALKANHALPSARIAVIERARQRQAGKTNNDRVWALGAAAIELLQSIRVLEELRSEYCHPYSKMVVWEEQGGGELQFQAAELGLDQLGCMVDADQLNAVLQNKLAVANGVDSLYESEISALDMDDSHARLTLKSGTILTASMVVAADGAQSWLRQQAKIPAPSKTYKQHGIVARIRTDVPHDDTAWQRFLSTGPVAVLPLANQYSSIVWSTKTQQAEQLMACDEQAFVDQLAEALGHRLGTIELAGPRFSFPLRSKQADRYYASRLALVGDAAHSIHPLAGQGANLGFQDVQALSDVFIQTDTLGEKELLKKYQRMRQPKNLQTDFLMTALHHAFQVNNPWWALLRAKGMQSVSSSPQLKSWLANRAIGL